MRRGRKILAWALLVFGALFLIAYSIFWHIVADEVRLAVDDAYQDMMESGIKVYGDYPKVSGFPGPPKVTFSGQVEQGPFLLDLPVLELKGFPFPEQGITVYLPEGGALKNHSDPDYPGSDLVSVDKLRLTFTLPARLPYDMTVEALRAWRDEGGSLLVNNFFVRKDSLEVTGGGLLRLDQELQPAGEVKVVSKGYMAFLGMLQSKDIVDNKAALIAGTVLNGLSKVDEDTGERYLEATLTLQNRKLLLGPLQLAALPHLQWGYDNPPAPPGQWHGESDVFE